MKELGSVAKQSGPRLYMVVLNTGLAIVWKHHVRRESMDRAVSDPSREVESQDNPSPPDIPLANLFSVDVPSPS